MAWAALSARRDAGGGLLLVGLSVRPETAAHFTAPGQYVEIVADGSAGFFVLAGRLGAPSWELLVRSAGGASEALASLPLESTLEVSHPLGEGFPLDLARGRSLVVAVAGSAVGVARPVMHARIASGEVASTRLYIGARSAPDVPLASELETWSRLGARVVLCLSQSEVDHDRDVLPSAERVPGYVQNAVAGIIDEPELLDGVVFAAGPEGMLAEMRDLGVDDRTRLGRRVAIVTNV